MFAATEHSSFYKALVRTFKFPDRFASSVDEDEFQSFHLDAFLRFRQVALFVGIVLWLSIAPLELDIHQSGTGRVPEPVRAALQGVDFLQALALRGGVALFATIMFCMTLMPRFRREPHSSLITCTGALAMGAGQVFYVHGLMPFPVGHIYYYNGIYLMFIGIFAFIHVSSRMAAIFGSLLFLILLLGMLLTRNGFEEYTSAYSVFPLLLLCHSIAVRFEGYERERFLREKSMQSSLVHEKQLKSEAIAEKKRADANSEMVIQLKEDQRRQAENANAQKSLFLAQAAHDLRQPMQAISNLLESSASAASGGNLSKTIELLGMMRLATGLMRSSFNAVLDISQLESKLVVPNLREFDLLPVLEHIATAAAQHATQRDVSLRRHMPGDVALVVRSDPELLARVVNNLVSNAIKYSDPRKASSRLLIRVVRLADQLRIDVVDNGVGIPKRHGGDIFRPFWQLNNPGRDRNKGLGLGLAIVQAIVDMLPGHAIDMRSREGQGTRFSVGLPLVRVEARRPQPAVVLPDVDVNHLYVLVVDDDVLVLASMQALLEQRGVLYESAGSIAEFQRLLETIEREPDVVVSDYKLQGSDSALDVARMVHEQFDRHLPMVVVTGEVGQEGALRDLPAGTAVIRKPVDPAELLRAIASAARAC